MKTTFFGSGPVAAKSLQNISNWLTIEAIVTKNKPPHHKDPAPVEELAKQLNIPVYFADTKLELDSLYKDNVLPVSPIGIVIDYGVIISQYVIDAYEFGIINSHFSLLPQWRGADPITYSLLSGQTKTGVSIMLIDRGMDTGPLLASKSIDISPSDNGETLTDNLVNLSNNLLIETVPKYLAGNIQPKAQPDNIATYSKMLNKNSGIISPSKTASELAREVKAFAGWPNSRLNYNDLWITVTKAEASTDAVEPGRLTNQNNQLLYGCKGGSLNILELKPAGKKNMTATAFINGYSSRVVK